MTKVSAIIVIKGYPKHLKQTLQSLDSLTHEIIVGDIGMAAEAKTVLKAFNHVKIIPVEKDIPYVELIREELKKYADGEYIVVIDPDEVLPKQLVHTIKEKLNDYDYFSIPRKNIIFGKWIRNSRWWPDYQIRVFRKNAVVWPTQIHKQPSVKGNGYTLEPKEEYAIEHYNYENVDEFLEKAVRYAKAEAQEVIQSGKTMDLHSTVKQSLSEFVSRFFAENGFKDGTHGFTLALLQMFYYFLVYFYYWEGKKYEESDTATLVKGTQAYFTQGLVETNYWISKKGLVGFAEKLKIKIHNILHKTTS